MPTLNHGDPFKNILDTLAVILLALSRTEDEPFLGTLHEVGTPEIQLTVGAMFDDIHV